MPEAATAPPTGTAAVAPGAAPAAVAGSATADAYSAIENLFPPIDEPSKPEGETKPGDGETKPDTETKPKEGETKPESKPGETTPVKPQKAASLREALDQEKGKVTTLTKEVEELKKQLAAPKEDPEKKKWLEERDTLTKSRTELESELKFAKYERSTEYKEQYEKPFMDAYAAGRKRAESLTIKEGDKVDDNGQVVEAGKTRKGSADDFDNLMGIGDDDSAWEYAKVTWGEKAQLVWLQREKVQELNQKRIGAIEDYRNKGADRDKQLTELSEKQTKEFQGLFDVEIKSAVENPALKSWFVPDEGDAKGKEYIEKGMKLADDAFGDTSKLTPQSRAKLYAAVRNRAAAAGLLAHKLATSNALVADLQKKLKEYEESEPNLDGRGGRRTGEATKKTGLSAFDAAVDKLAQ